MKDKFWYNRKRKHYSYVYKIINDYCANILLTTKAESKQKKHRKSKIVKNIKLFRHPNKNSVSDVYIYNHPPYYDQKKSFDERKLNWCWDINDKRKVKRMKKYEKYYRNKNSR